jgi:hypothetical protein
MALHINRPIPISLYFCFLSRMVIGSIEDLPGSACLAALPDPSGRLEINNTMEIRSIMETCNFRNAPVVGVPIAKVANTLVSWLRWMAGSYVGRLDTKTTSLRSSCLKILRSCNTSVYLWLCQSSWVPRMRDLLRSVCFRSPASLLWTPGVLRQNEGLSVGCAPDGPAKRFWVLGRYRLETFLRSACLGWLRLTPHSNEGYLDVSTLHMFKTNITLLIFITDNLFMRRNFQDPARYPRILDIVDLRPL